MLLYLVSHAFWLWPLGLVMLNDVELRHLRYFVAVAEEKNITRAAARLFVTQPALSRQIKDLEKLLDVTLFIRASAGLTLTPAARALLPQARQILEDAASAMLSMHHFAECRNNSLAIGYIAPALGSFLGEALQLFRQKHPQIEIKLFELSPARQLDALREGRLDIALIGHACEELQREFETVTIRRIPLVAVLHATHSLAKRGVMELKELEKEEFVGLDESTFPGRNDVIREACRAAGFTPHIAHQVDGLSTMLALIGSGSCVSLMPDEVQQLPHANAVFIPLHKPTCHIDFSAALCVGEKRPIVRTILQEFRTVTVNTEL
jgi:DNA-binding transcriptional LysR family regulator